MSDKIVAIGGCYCGQTRYEAEGPVILKGQCHCRPCQFITGGGPNYFMVVPSAGYQITQGQVSQFTRDDIENPRTREFCPNCGTHLNTRNYDMGITIIKVGTLDDPQATYGGPVMAIHCKNIPGFHQVPDGLPMHSEGPPRK